MMPAQRRRIVPRQQQQALKKSKRKGSCLPFKVILFVIVALCFICLLSVNRIMFEESIADIDEKVDPIYAGISPESNSLEADLENRKQSKELPSRPSSSKQDDNSEKNGTKNSIRKKDSKEKKENTTPKEKQKIVSTIAKKPPAETTESSENEPDYHIVFSTSCIPFQRWQSYLLFYSAKMVKQPGKVTRIVSGCSDKEAEDEKKWHDTVVNEQMSSDFHIHFTPHFATVIDKETGKKKMDYKFFNKPFGLKHWMEYGNDMGFSSDETSTTNRLKDTVVILLDPDQVLTRPITNDFSNPDDTIVRKRFDDRRQYKVRHGYPFAQLYGFGATWQKRNVAEIAGADSPAVTTTHEEALKHYPAGPPYLATALDMYNIAVKWSEFVPKVHAEFPELMAEMYAFCIAAAHLKLPHQIVNSLMVSHSGINEEGWEFVDKESPDDICQIAKDHSKGVDYYEAAQGMKRPTFASVLHYCQRFIVGTSFFGKHRVPHGVFSCDEPLVMLPPNDLPLKYDYFIPPPQKKGGTPGEKQSLSEKAVKRNSFMICYLSQSMHDAAKFYKRNNCENPNMEETLELWKE